MSVYHDLLAFSNELFGEVILTQEVNKSCDTSRVVTTNRKSNIYKFSFPPFKVGRKLKFKI